MGFGADAFVGGEGQHSTHPQGLGLAGLSVVPKTRLKIAVRLITAR